MYIHVGISCGITTYQKFCCSEYHKNGIMATKKCTFFTFFAVSCTIYIRYCGRLISFIILSDFVYTIPNVYSSSTLNKRISPVYIWSFQRIKENYPSDCFAGFLSVLTSVFTSYTLDSVYTTRYNSYCRKGGTNSHAHRV